MNPSSHRLQPLDFILIYFLSNLLAGLFQVPLRLQFPALADSTTGLLLSGLWLQDGLVLVLIAFFLQLRQARWQTLGTTRPQGRLALPAAAGWGLALYILMVLLTQLLDALLPNGLSAQNVASYMQPDDALWQKAFVLLTMGVFVPIVEELLFRGYLYQSLCKYLHPQLAMVIGALIFGCAHFDLQRLLPLALGGYLLNLIAVRYRSVFASALSHGIWNSVMIVAYYLAI